MLIQRRLYIIDDDAAVRRVVDRAFKDENITIEEFDSAEAFLAIHAELPTGCLLLDVRLPGMSGLSLLERISGHSGIAVVMLSGSADVPSAVRALKMGAVDFLQKPFRKNELVAVINKACDIIDSAAEGQRKLESLTPREREVLEALVGGAPNKVVAYELGISPRTVEMHRARIFKKLGVTNLAQALLCTRDNPTASR